MSPTLLNVLLGFVLLRHFLLQQSSCFCMLPLHLILVLMKFQTRL